KAPAHPPEPVVDRESPILVDDFGGAELDCQVFFPKNPGAWKCRKLRDFRAKIPFRRKPPRNLQIINKPFTINNLLI
ncbi:MAG: hypothetical protein OXU98_04235, partial [Gammaproteobacteria bacterium]|nr:hypothetical protein [Gammaproteobacteria bacterium]